MVFFFCFCFILTLLRAKAKQDLFRSETAWKYQKQNKQKEFLSRSKKKLCFFILNKRNVDIQDK
jgi:hypothetical protein